MTHSQSVIINFGNGNLNKGFERVTTQLCIAGNPLPQQFTGSLPPAPHLVELYKNWQSIYQALCARPNIPSRLKQEEEEDDDDDDELEIDSGGITCISELSFDELCQNLQEGINGWLKSEGFLNIERQLRTELDPNEEIRVIIETNNLLLQRLPWHRWDFYRDYSKVEMALSKSEYKRARCSPPKLKRKKVRILAILGNSQGIDLERESKFLKNLQDSETVFLVKPSRVEFNKQLWDEQGWDILFFAGHSQSEGETGRIYINENQTNNSLIIEQLEEALKAAIDNGLKLAIFNSCDGLGLANALEKLNIPTIIVMREPVPNLVAQEFFQHFLLAFARERLSLYLAVQQARRKLQGLEDEFLGASWLPVIFQNPAVEPPSWLFLGGIPPCPYRGLFAFREEDAHLFFGREQFTSDLVAAVKRKSLVAVLGPSGSGKSSVVLAGLIRRLRQDPNIEWQIVWFRPGKNPFEALAAALAPLWQQIDSITRREIQISGQVNGNEITCLEKEEENVEKENCRRLHPWELAIALQQDDSILYKIVDSIVQQNPGTRLVLIVDQFEELYTQTLESERQPFLDRLLNAVRLAPAFTLVLTLRADFYGYALSYRPFSDALQGAVWNLGPMSREELRSAIEEPAAQMQVRLEKGLSEKLINAMKEQPGHLPLLEFTLTQLWSKHHSGLLTHQAYSEIGGLSLALANHAEAVYAQLNQVDRARTQRVFVQLVNPGEGTETTRRLATSDEVNLENWDLVTQLASNRLLVTNRNESTGEETVEIVHEALIRSWGRLGEWMEVNGEFRRWQEELRGIIRQWENSDRDQGALLRGKPLADAEYWHNKRREELSLREQTFIEQSLALCDRELKSQKLRQKRTILGLTSGLVGALMLAVVAWRQWQNAAHSEIEAISASSEALYVSNNKLDALIEAIRARQKLHATHRVDAETKTKVDAVLRQAVYGVVEYNRLSRHRDEVKSVAFSRDGRTIASASSDKTIKLWKPDGTLITTIAGHSDLIWQLAFSPDGQMLASASKDKTIKLWKIEAGKIPILLTTLVDHNHDVRGVAFSPDGQMLASASDDQTVKLWRRDGTLITTIAGHTNIVNGVAFSPDGQMLASTSWDKTVKLWKLETGKMPTLLKTLTGHTKVVYGVAFSPNSQILASTSWDKTVKLWKPDGTLIATLNGHNARVWGVAFSPDRKNLASAGDDKTVKLWNLKSPLVTKLIGHSAVVIGVAFSPDGQILASVSDDKTVKLWKPDGTLIATLNGHNAQVYGVAFSPNGQILASASADNTIKLWNIKQKTPQLLTTLKGHQASVWGVAFSPDGQTIASAAGDNTVMLWNLGKKKRQLLAILKRHQASVFGVAFSPDGQILASTSADRTVKLWKVKPAQMPVLLRTLTGHTAQVYGVAFSPDGQTIASASADNTIKLWKPDGTLLTTLNGHSAVVYGVAFSPDGQTIASASWDKTIKLWKPDGTLLTTLNGYNGQFWKLAFSPDSQTVASANEDTTVILWNKEQVLKLDPLTYGCNWLRDYLKTNPHVRDRHLCDN
ncbi:MAG: CHAT domain-containing protein [Prochloraceae cyanobacterium]|nr:CHAT domain-containing protein [Prochloraceae cyanobacterium]